MKYTVIVRDYLSKLEKAVKLKIEEGYELQGGIAVVYERKDYYRYYQAMVKR